VLIEFVGASGVGKSFLAEKILKELKKRNVSVAKFKSIRIRRYSVRNLFKVLHATLLILLLMPEKLKKYVRSVRRLARYKIRQRSCDSSHAVYICDEGVFQMLRTLHRNSRLYNMTDIADQLFKHVKLPDIVVVVEAGVEEIFVRRSDRNRQNDSFNRDSVKRDVLLIEDTIKAIKHAQRFLKGNMQMIILNVEKDDTEAAVENTVNFIQAHLDRA